MRCGWRFRGFDAWRKKRSNRFSTVEGTSTRPHYWIPCLNVAWFHSWATQQIVGRERREGLSQLALCGGGGFYLRPPGNSTLLRLLFFTFFFIIFAPVGEPIFLFPPPPSPPKIYS